MVRTTRRTDIQTGFGQVSVVWRLVDDAPKVVRLFLSSPGVSAVSMAEKYFPGSPVSVNSTIDYVVKGVTETLTGRRVIFPLYLVDLSVCSDFQRRVLETVHRIPRGSVATYREIAVSLGKPGASRAVGTALAKNPFPLLIPCHRAIRSDGNSGGYQGGEEMKRCLLESEGVDFGPSGLILGKYRYSYGRRISNG